MLADWYFCTALRLTVRQTSDYLNALMVVRDPVGNARLLPIALDHLEVCEPALRLRALSPLLVAVEALPTDTALADRVVTIGAGLLEDTEAAHPKPSMDTRMNLSELLREAVFGQSDDFSERVLGALREFPDLSGGQTLAGESEPYQDLHEHITETVALILLDVAARHDPATVEPACTGQAPLGVFADALKNSLGREPFLLAVSVLHRIAPAVTGPEIRARLIRAGDGAGDIEPDILEALAWSWFGRPRDDRGPDPSALEAEISTGILLRQWIVRERFAAGRRAAVRSRLGVGTMPDPVVRTVLWQLTLWELGIAHCPLTMARVTRRWWGPPADDRDDPNSRTGNAVFAISWPDQVPGPDDIAETEQWLGTAARMHWSAKHKGTPRLRAALPGEEGVDPCAACSPWLDRRSADYFLPQQLAPERRADLSQYPTSGSGLVMLHLLTVVAAAVRLLRALGSGSESSGTDSAATPAPRGHLVALVFHCKDVLTDVRCRFFLDDLRAGVDRPANQPISAGLAGMAYQVLRLVDAVGKGELPEIPVAWFAEFLLEGPGIAEGGDEPGGGRYDGTQWQRLFGGPALQGVRHWIEDIAAAVRNGAHGAGDRAGWFDGPAPYARRVLATVIERLQQSQSKDAAIASVQLLRQNFPDARVRAQLDWMDRLPAMQSTFETRLAAAEKTGGRAKSPLNFRLLLAADRYPLAVWRRNADAIERLTPTGAERGARVTLEIAALLGESEPGDEADVPLWVDNWFDLMSGINNQTKWARAIRDRALDLFQLPPRGLAAQDRTRRVLEYLIDAIAEFSAGAPRYYQRMLGALTDSEGPLHPEGMDRLRVRAVHAIRSHQRNRRDMPQSRELWEAVSQRNNEAEIELLLRVFVTTMGTRELGWNDRHTLSRAFLETWGRLTCDAVGSRVVSVIGAGVPAPDPRLVVARIFDRYSGQERTEVLNQAIEYRADGGKASDLSALEPQERIRKLDRWRHFKQAKLVVGVVCALDDTGDVTDRHRAGRAVLVNCGVGEPIPCIAPEDDPRFQLGDLCVLKVRWDANSRSWLSVEQDLVQRVGRAAPTAGEVRAAYVTLGGAGAELRVSVDGHRSDILRGTASVVRETLLRHWDSDLTRALCATAGTAGVPAAEPTLARWDADLENWLPVDRTLTELLAGELPYRDGAGHRADVLVYVGRGDPALPHGHGCWRFATRPGHSFLLHPRDFHTGRTDLEAVLGHGPGVLVYVVMSDPADPRLALLADPPVGAEARWPGLNRGIGCDTRNNDWLALFEVSENQMWQARLGEHGWQVDVADAPRYRRGIGLPTTIPVVGLETEGGVRCPFEPVPWDELQARSAEVEGEPLRQESLPFEFGRPTADAFTALWDIDEHSTHRIRRFYRTHAIDGTWIEASIESGLTVRVERNSLIYARIPSDRPERLEILRVRHFRRRNLDAAPAPLSTGQFARLLPGHGRVGGRVDVIIHTFYRGGDGRFDRFGVWVRLADGTLDHFPVPAGCFAGRVRRLGETFTGELGARGWEFLPTGREIYARVLYRHERVARPPVLPWRYLGWIPQRGGGFALYADPDSGTVRTAEVDKPSAAPLGERASAVEKLGGAAPRRGVEHMRVRVSAGVLQLVADAPATSTIPGLVSRVIPHAWIRDDGFIAIWRDLVITSAVPTESVSGAGQAIEDEWRERLAAGETVQITGRLVDNVLRHSAGGRLPLVEGDAPYIAGVFYSDKRVGAAVVDIGGALCADTRSVPAHTAADFAAEVAGVPAGTVSRRHRLGRFAYYVGTEDRRGVAVRRFEWGRGYSVLLDATELRVHGNPCDDERVFPMYHGDRLIGADFLLGADGRRIINIEPERDIEIQTATMVYNERTKSILHRLLVKVDLRARRVTVEQVRLVSSHTSDSADQSLQRPIAAELDEPSREHILAAVAANSRPDALVDIEIVARFDEEGYQRERGRQRVFHYVESRFVGVDSPAGILPSEHLLMVAGEIARPDDNDSYIEFRLPSGVLQEPGAESFTVRIARKQFSCRESLLPLLLHEKHGDYFSHTTMLVKLFYNEGNRRWQGDLTHLPARQPDVLAGAVDRAGGSMLAIVSDSSGRRVEVRPGVICELGAARGLAGVRDAGRGAVVRVRRSGDGLEVALAQRPDKEYLPRNGARAALMLPKQPLLGAQGLRRARDAGAFTVAGLPAVEVTAGEYGPALLRSPHPRKIALIRRGDREVVVVPSDNAPVRAATVRTNGDQPIARAFGPVLRERRAGTPEPFPIPWSQLSFADTDVADLRERVKATWNYHDAMTWHWSGTRCSKPYDISERALHCEPVFFDEYVGVWTLRYRPEKIDRYGGPATVLTERRATPGESADSVPAPGQEWFVVACPATREAGRDASGLWVEVSPGRVAELSGPLIVGPGQIPLDSLCWKLFGPGDRIRLEPIRRDLIEPQWLQLAEWRPSVRSALLAGEPSGSGARRALLPVTSVDPGRGGLLLGVGEYCMTFPLIGADLVRYRPGDAVWLSRANHLDPAANATPAPGDTALAGIGADGELSLLGLAGFRAKPAVERELWPGAGWLAELLSGPRVGSAIRALGGCLPVTVERVGDGVVEFSRRMQPESFWPRYQLVRCAVTGSMGDRLLLRSGGAVYRLGVQEVVRGVPDAQAVAAARAFAEHGGVVWCRWERVGDDRRVETRLAVESRSSVLGDEFEVEPLIAVNADDRVAGLVVRAVHNQGYHWMPADRTSWLDAPTSAELECFLLDPGRPLRVREFRNGWVSVVDVRVVQHQRGALRLGSSFRAEPLSTPRRSGQCSVVARVCTNQVLVRLEVEPGDWAQGEPLDTEVARLGGRLSSGPVTVVPKGLRRHPVDLPARLTTGRAEPAAREHDQLAARYARWWNEGMLATVSGTAPGSDPTEDLLRAVGSVRTGQCDPSQADQGLDRWLAEHGEAAFNLRPNEELELSTLLAACLLLEARGSCGNAIAARGAVLLTHQTGLRAARSLHVEHIVRHWLPLGRSDSGAPVLSARARLATLEFPAELDRTGVRALLDFGYGILARIADGGLDEGSAPIARAVLAAAGRLLPDSSLRQGAELLGPLAALGRALCPPRSEAVAQPALAPAQIAMLSATLRRSLDCPVPLLALSPLNVLSGEARRLATGVLSEAV
ncbi:hypothetical protein [Nocardia tengchongensis]|uniref:hypothetical protein n=1 Tax=Nocardia tengchongensis TaxID=2055889 RepID=UPI0036BAF04D